MNDLSRRTILTAPALLSLAATTTAWAEPADISRRAGSAILVAYFTRSGNTRVIAGTLQHALAAELFEIRPARPYPEDYEQTVEQARQERDRGYEPPLEAKVPDIAACETLFLGFPIWGQTTPPVIRSFLRAHDLTGKTLRPFITHGGYGLGDSLAVLADHAPGARIEPPFSMEADQERRYSPNKRRWK
ncbi:flavodoxin [Inquilinus sp. CAU 1745]|uniref:flavodoxin n=1 Tax=Inquilinus sp. CAU 1745 TaxID=3140369 RepID=UPI00325BCF75